MSIYFGYESEINLDSIEKKIEKNKKDIARTDAVALTAKTNSLANKADITTNKSDISTNNTNIVQTGSRVTTAQNKADTAYNKSVANGDKILKKVAFMQNFTFRFSNPTVGSWNEPIATIPGYPKVYMPLLHRSDDMFIHIQLHVFDSDSTMDSTEKAQYRLDFVQSNGNSINWDSAEQTISSKRLIYTQYAVDIKMSPSNNFSVWDDFRAFTLLYKPVTTTKVNGNESIVHVCVYSP